MVLTQQPLLQLIVIWYDYYSQVTTTLTAYKPIIHQQIALPTSSICPDTVPLNCADRPFITQTNLSQQVGLDLTNGIQIKTA